MQNADEVSNITSQPNAFKTSAQKAILSDGQTMDKQDISQPCGFPIKQPISSFSDRKFDLVFHNNTVLQYDLYFFKGTKTLLVLIVCPCVFLRGYFLQRYRQRQVFTRQAWDRSRKLDCIWRGVSSWCKDLWSYFIHPSCFVFQYHGNIIE